MWQSFLQTITDFFIDIILWHRWFTFGLSYPPSKIPQHYLHGRILYQDQRLLRSQKSHFQKTASCLVIFPPRMKSNSQYECRQFKATGQCQSPLISSSILCFHVFECWECQHWPLDIANVQQENISQLWVVDDDCCCYFKLIWFNASVILYSPLHCCDVAVLTVMCGHMRLRQLDVVFVAIGSSWEYHG